MKYAPDIAFALRSADTPLPVSFSSYFLNLGEFCRINVLFVAGDVCDCFFVSSLDIYSLFQDWG